MGKVDADRDKAVIFNVDICDYYFIILKYNIISRLFVSLKAELCEELPEHRALEQSTRRMMMLMFQIRSGGNPSLADRVTQFN